MSTERDLAHEADMEELRREQLRADVDVSECDCHDCYIERFMRDDTPTGDDYEVDYDDERFMLDQEQPD